MPPTRYDLVYALAAPAVLPWLAWRRLRRGKYGQSGRGMLGAGLPAPAAQGGPFAAGSLWLHAVSYGEVNAARAVAPGLQAALPGLPLVVSTITETGQAHARQSFPGAAAVTYFPADFSTLVARFQAAYNPRVFVLLETELWPNFLLQAARRGTRCFMINGKVSDRSFPRYLRVRGWLRPALAAFGGVCVQTDVDAERFAALGIPEARLRVTGNCKFDLLPEPLSGDERAALLARFGMDPTRRWIVAGSTHPTEEALILDAFAQVQAREPRAGLLLAPRHPDRFEEVARLLEARGLAFTRASEAPASDPSTQPANPETAPIVLLDQMGVLARAYGLGEVAIVAGSFCPVGGHNLLEAAAHNVPVVYGPDLHSQREIGRLFQLGKAGLQVPAAQLAPTLTRLLTDEPYRAAQATACLEVTRRNRGSAARAVAAVAEWMTEEKGPEARSSRHE